MPGGEDLAQLKINGFIFKKAGGPHLEKNPKFHTARETVTVECANAWSSLLRARKLKPELSARHGAPRESVPLILKR